jgi:hypothetical protein
MGIDLLAGRDFTPFDDAGAPAVAIVDEALARRFFGDPAAALGAHLLLDVGGDVAVVGVARGVRHDTLDEPPAATVYLPIAQCPAVALPFLAARVFLVVRGDAMQGDDLAREVHAVDREAAVSEARTLGQLVAGAVAPRRFIVRILEWFAAVALALATLGLFGVLSTSVAERTQEIGIRRALGATDGAVVALVLRRGMGLALAGTGAGLLGALCASRLVAGLLFGVSATDPATYAALSALLLAASASACLIPAWRAARLDPMAALRS